MVVETMPAARRQEIAARLRRARSLQLDEALELRASSQGGGGGESYLVGRGRRCPPALFPRQRGPGCWPSRPAVSGLAAPVAAAPVPSAAPASAGLGFSAV